VGARARNEPLFAWRSRPILRSYALRAQKWRAAPLRLVVLSDLHVIAPWSSLALLRSTIAQINALRPDLIVLPGDFITHDSFGLPSTPIEQIAPVLAGLQAPLRVFCTLGNHDWADCKTTQVGGAATSHVAEVLEANGLPVLSNRAVQVRDFTLVGFDSAQGEGRPHSPVDRSHPARAFADVPKDASVLLLAHEPDTFAQVDPRVALQISGHTHAGQLNLLGWRPLTPSRFGGRYAAGHVSENQAHLVVNGGWGFTAVPLRIGAAPEFTLINLKAED
jgi:hypothetical protein